MAEEPRDESQQEDERHDDLELPDETAEEVKGGSSDIWLKTANKAPYKE